MILYYSGGDKKQGGVGFMVDSRTTRSMIAFQPFSNRLAILTIDGTVMTHIVSIYAPTDVSPDNMKDDFYTQLQDALGTIPGRDLVILAGDFNAHVGTDRAGWEGMLGRFSVGTNNDNGLRLLSFAAFNNLIIGNSHFQHPRKHQLTWRHPSGKDTAVLDYFLISHLNASSLDIAARGVNDTTQEIKYQQHNTPPNCEALLYVKYQWPCWKTIRRAGGLKAGVFGTR
ncbi:UNVERIFIED_CONTAM: hypothetical protein FKN15_043035 [Acipenser sinensis]